MTATDTKPMTIETTGKRVVMFGVRPDVDERSWFERYYPTTEAAQKYAAKRGWAVVIKGS